MPPSDEHDWIFDFVLQFLESDKFDASVMDFVDEKCFTFENEEENKFEYTDIHKEFRDHIEALISSNLGELGITSEMFFESCEKGRNNRDINKQVFERMIAMEDFETFKKLMTKRNMELQLGAIQSYSVTKSPHTRKLLRSSYADNGEDQQMKEAMAASLRCGENERDRSQLPVPEALRALLFDDGDGKQVPIGENEMQEILHRSLMEMEILHRQAELEQADLEQAVALSLALEEERLRLQQVEEKNCITPKRRADSFLLPYGSGDKDVDTKDSKGTYSPDDAKSSRRGEREESASKQSSSSASASSSSGGNNNLNSNSNNQLNRQKIQEDDELLSNLTDNQMSLTSALAVSDSYNSDSDSKYSPGKNKNSNQNFIEDDDNIGRRRAGPRPIGKTNLTDFADPKPLNGRIGYGAMSALPSISAGSGALNEKKKQAADEIKKGQLQLSEQRKQEDELRKHLGNINSEEVEKRAQHMAEQRDKLILMKKLERDRKVREEEERQLKLNADNYGNGNNGNGEITESQLRAKVQAQVLALNQNKSEAKGSDRGDRGGERGSDRGSDGIDLDDKRRSAMRVALARRMKLDLIESEEIKLAQMQEDQFADLDRKLQQVEQLRRDNKQREIVITEQLRKQQENIARNIQRSALELRR